MIRKLAESPLAYFVVEMLDALPDDGQRYEIIDGVLYVTPAPSDVHQLIVAAFYKPIDAYLRPSKLARAMFSPADVRKGDRKRNRVQPDVFAARLIDGKRPPYPYELSDLLIAPARRWLAGATLPTILDRER